MGILKILFLKMCVCCESATTALPVKDGGHREGVVRGLKAHVEETKAGEERERSVKRR